MDIFHIWCHNPKRVFIWFLIFCNLSPLFKFIPDGSSDSKCCSKTGNGTNMGWEKFKIINQKLEREKFQGYFKREIKEMSEGVFLKRETESLLKG